MVEEVCLSEPVLLHPNMAEVYRAKVARLVDALNDERDRTEAAEMLRGLIDRIVLTPKEEDGRQSLSIDLEGALAGVLALATNDKRPLTGSGLSEITLADSSPYLRSLSELGRYGGPSAKTASFEISPSGTHWFAVATVLGLSNA